MKILRLPGLLDIHVHLRDPGETHKEDFYTGTCAALAGGVTAVFDMPNNVIPIFSQQALKNKVSVARQKAVCDWGIYFGSDGKNIRDFEKIRDRAVGLKLYLSLTTGKYLIEDNNLLEKIFNAWPKEKVIVIHAESEKIDLAIDLTRRHNNKLHITHVSTKPDLVKIIAAKKERLPVTCDVTPHHLFLTKDDENKLGSFALVRPPLASLEDQTYLWNHLSDIDCISTDHAPHAKQEKESDNPPFGVPGLETMLPLLITAMKNGKLTQKDIVRLTNTNPQKIFGITQQNDTYVEVDADDCYEIENGKLFTKCGWSPYAGQKIYGRVKKVFIRGTKAFEDGKILVSPGFGRSIL